MKHHMISGKDSASAVTQAASTLRHGSVPSVFGNMLHFGNAPVPSFNLSGACIPQQKHPPRPQSNRHTAKPPLAATPGAPRDVAAASEPESTPGAPSPHAGIGVHAPPNPSSTSELVLVNSPGVTPVTLNNEASSRGSTAAVPVYHPQMRTGMSSVSKASIAATATPIGVKALKEHQKELERNMKVRK